MFRSNWPSSGVRVVVMEVFAALIFLRNCLGLFLVILAIVLFPCTCYVHDLFVAVLNILVGRNHPACRPALAVIRGQLSQNK
jgi:hypothetical protein